MKQIVQNFKTGVVSVEDVPPPVLKPGCVLVRNSASLISTGTEGGTVKLGKMSLLGKARARPEQVKKVLQALRTEGIVGTVNAVNRTLDIPIPLGYSCAGVVEAVSDDVADIPVGTRVACGGAGMANHAEYVVIPRNLCVPIPVNVLFRHAAFTTVGAIAMQSVRIANPRIGENVVVIGLGLVGLLVAKILNASGCNVLGIDVNSQRVAWVKEKKICTAVERHSTNIQAKVLEFSNGYGADAVIITAAVASNDPVALAGEIARYKGRVVVVGRTIMDAPRETYLFKELELCTSYAYGPGTGDSSYEKEGYDYPIGYVRWTENRNMECFLELLNKERIDLSPLISYTFPVENAPDAFEQITKPETQAIGVILEYGKEMRGEDEKLSFLKKLSFSAGDDGVISCGYYPTQQPETYITPSKLRIGIIGAGSFATNVMVPLLAKRKDILIQGIVSANGLKATTLAKKYRIPLFASDARVIADSPNIDAVFILTRHETHAAFAERALSAGKHVFVEKPLALTQESLNAVIQAQQKTGKVLMVGFNRRYSPLAQRLKTFFDNRCQPMVISFRGNVGYRPPEHWLHDPVDGGGVILGEACHYIDFCRWLTDSSIIEINARCVGKSKSGIIPEDNVEIAIRFEDGSLANVLYLSNGAKGYSRERCEVHAEAKSGVWEDFKSVRLVNDLSLPKTHRTWLFHQKGYKEELDAFFAAIQGKSKMGWLAGQVDVSLAVIKVSKSI